MNPNSGEAHLALALHLYWGYFDYAAPAPSLLLPNALCLTTHTVFEVTAWIDRRQGRWSDAVRNMERASELDPRNFFLAGMLRVYFFVRAYEQTRKALDRMLALKPNDIEQG